MQSMRASTAMALVLGVAAGFNPAVSQAQTIPINRTPPVVAADARTRVSVAVTGAPIVNIALPRADGTSYNVFSKFDVGREGMIFNNSPTIGDSVLGGKTLPNPTLVRNGSSAKLILNEVLGGTRSNLRGPIEVFGPSAAIVIANPSGITCDGCGFINVPRATLSTGKIVFGADGSFAGLRVDGGDVKIEGQGLLAGNVDFFDIVTAATSLSANIYARDLLISGGTADYEYARRQTTATGGGLQFAIDSSLLGGMYANRIRLIGNGDGIGMNLKGLVNALDGPLAITASGTIAVQSAASSQHLEIRSTSGDVAVGDQLYAGDSIAVFAGRNILQSGDLIGAAHDVRLDALGDIQLAGSGVYAGLGTEGKLDQVGELTITAGGVVRATGVRAIATGDAKISAIGAVLDASSIISGGNVTLRITQNLASIGRIEGTKNILLDAQQIQLAGEVIANGNLDVHAKNVSLGGRAAGLTQLSIRASNAVDATAAADLQSKGSVEIASLFLNSAGRVLAENSVSIQSVNSLVNSGDMLAGANVSLSGNSVSLGGNISSNKDLSVISTNKTLITGGLSAVGLLSVSSGPLDISGTLSSRDKLALTSTGEALLAATSLVVSDDDVEVSAFSIDAKGLFSSKKSLSVKVSAAADLSGKATVGSLLTVKALRVDVSGSLISNGTIKLDTSGDQNISGLLSALDTIEINSGTDLSVSSAAQVVATNAIRASVQRDVGNSGVFSSTNTSLVAGGHLSNVGTFFAGDSLHISAVKSIAQAGISQSANALNLSGDVVTLSGTTVANKTVVVTGHTVDMTVGNDLESGDTLLVSGDRGVTLSGKIVSVGDLSVTSRGDITQASDIASAKKVTITAGGILALNGTVSAIGQINLAGRGILGSALLGTDDAIVINATMAGIDFAGQGSARGGISLAAIDDINLSGTLATDGLLRLSARDLVVSGSIAAVGGILLTLPGDLTINSQGALRSGVPIAFSLTNLRNSGTLAALGDLTVRTAMVDNDGQLLSSRSVALTAVGNLNNNGLISAGLDLSINAAKLDSSGTLESGRSINLSIDSGVVAGSVSSSGNITAASLSGSLLFGGSVTGADVKLSSSGGGLSVTAPAVIAATGRALLTTGSDLVVNGSIQTNAGIDLTAGNDLTFGETATVLTNGALNVSAARSIVNASTLISSGPLSITGTDVRLGRLASNQDISVSATRKITVNNNIVTVSSLLFTGATASFDVLASGSLAAGRDITLDAGQGILNAGTLTADRDATLRGGTQVVNTGQIAARLGTANISGAALNLGGVLFAKRTLVLSSNQILISGIVGSDGSSDIASRSLIVGPSGILQSNSNLKLTFSDVQIDGSILALDTLTVDGGSATISASGKIASTSDQNLFISGSVSNLGSISSNSKLGLTANSITNAGAIVAAGDLAIAATSVTNRGQLGGASSVRITANTLTNVAAGTIQAANALTLDTFVLSSAGSIEAVGPLALTARTSFMETGTLRSNAAITLSSNGAVSIGGRLDAGSTLSIVAGSLSIPGELTVNNDISLSAATGDLDVIGKITGGALIVATARESLNVGASGLLYGTSGLTVGGNRVIIAGDFASPGDVAIRAVSSIEVSGLVVSNSGADLRSGAGTTVATTGVVNSGVVRLEAGNLAVAGIVRSAGLASLNVTGGTNVGGSLTAKGDVQVVGGGDFAVNLGGNLISERNIFLSSVGKLDVAGTVAATGNIMGQVNGAASFSGVLQSGTDLSLTVLGSNTLEIGGQVFAAHDIALTGGIVSVTGSVVAGNFFSLASDKVESNLKSLQVDGTIAASGAANLTTAGGIAIGANGSLYTISGDLNLSAGYLDVSGVLASGKTLSYTTRHDLDGSTALPATEIVLGGTVQALGSLTLAGSRGFALLSGGTIVSNDRVVIGGQGIVLDGQASAKNVISLIGAGDISVGATLQTTDRISILAGGNLTLGLSGRLEVVGNGRSTGLVSGAGSNANIALSASGSLTNLGTIFSDGSVALYADTGDVANSGNITVQRDVVFESRLGRIESSASVISATNIGILQNATDFTNTGTLAAQGNLLISALGISNSGLLGSNGALQLNAGADGFLNFSHGTIFSATSVTITSGIASPSGTGTFSNNQASIISIGDINIAANDLFNSSGSIESLAGNVNIQANNLTNQIANLVIANDPTEDRVVVNTGPAQISAAKDLSITALGIVTNSNSSLAAGGNVTITADTVNNVATALRQTGGGTLLLPTSIVANGLVTINANLFNNGSITPSGVFNGTGSGLPSVTIVPATEAGGRGTYSPPANPNGGSLPGGGTPNGAGNGGNPTNASPGGISIQSGGLLSTGGSSASGTGFLGTITSPTPGSNAGAISPADGGPSSVATSTSSVGSTAQTGSPSGGFGGIAIPTILGTNGQTGQFIADFLRKFNLVDANGNFAIAGNGRLFIFSDSPETQAILVTNRGFASVADLLDSSFFFNQLSVDRGTNFVRLGDGFFEAQLLSQEVRAATGRVLLPQFADSLEQAKALLQSGVDQQQALNLKVGAALTSEQIANLKSSLAWYVETDVAGRKVLVPVVYLAANDAKAFKDGAIVSAANVVTNITSDLINGGTIRADKVVSLTAGGNIVNASGSVIAASDLVAKATNNVLVTAATINVANTAVVSAGRNIDIGGLIRSSTQPVLAQGVSGQIATDAFKGSTIVTGGDFYAIAGGNLTIRGSSLTSGGDVWLVGSKGIDVLAGQTNTATATSWTNNYRNTRETTNVLSEIIGDKISVSSPGRVNIAGGNVSAGGALSIAGGSVGLSGVVDVAVVDSYSYSKKCGWFSCKKTTVITNSSVQKAIVTTLEGGQVSITSLGDIDLSGVNLVSDFGTIVTADGNINIGALESFSQESQIVKTKKTGFSFDGFGFFIGSRSSTQVSVNGSKLVTGSLVGTTNGDTDITAQRDLIITASQIVSSGLTSLTGRSITIQGGTDVETTYSKYVAKQAGLGFKIGNSVLDGFDTLERLNAAADRGQSGRVKAITALAAITTAKNAYDGLQRTIDDPKGNVSVSLSLGIDKSSFESSSRQETNVASSIRGGDVRITATDGSVKIAGSNVNADRSILVVAPQEVLLEGAAQSGITTTNSSSSGYGVFARLAPSSNTNPTGEASVGVNVSGSKGSSLDQTVTYAPTTLRAGDRITISTSGATIIRGATVDAAGVKLTTGSLLIESVQNTAYYDSVNRNFGLNISYNFASQSLNLQANYGQQKLNGDYRSVDQQSGIFAGAGGFDVSVKNDTVLIGGAIYSSAPKASNTFTTGTFSFADLENVEKYSASSLGINVSSSGSLSSPFASPAAGLPSYVFASGQEASKTQSLLSAANTTITGGDSASAAALASVLSDPTLANNPLIKQFTVAERDRIQAGFEVVSILRQEVGTFLANRSKEADDKRAAAKKAEDNKDYATAKQLLLDANEIESNWGMGGGYRQILTALAAAAGGNLSGSVGALIKDTAINLLQQRGSEYIGDLSKDGKINDAQADILHALVGCATQAAGAGSCAGGAAGEGGAALLNQLLESQNLNNPNLTNQEREARSALLQSLVAGLGAVSGVDGAQLAGAVFGAQAETENNALGRQQWLQLEQQLAACNVTLCEVKVGGRYLLIDKAQDAAFETGLVAGVGQSALDFVVGLGELTIALRNDPKAVFSAIRSALTDPEVRSKLGDNIVAEYQLKIDALEFYGLQAAEVGGLDNNYEFGKRTSVLVADVLSLFAGAKAAVTLTTKMATVGVRLAVKAGGAAELAAASARAADDAVGAVSKIASETTQLNIPGRVQSRVNLMNGSQAKGEGWNHVLADHFNLAKGGKSQFTVGQAELRSILQAKDVVGSPVTRVLESSRGPRYVREITLDSRSIGFDVTTRSPTSTFTIITDKYGNLITTFPGKLK